MIRGDAAFLERLRLLIHRSLMVDSLPFLRSPSQRRLAERRRGGGSSVEIVR